MGLVLKHWLWIGFGVAGVAGTALIGVAPVASAHSVFSRAELGNSSGARGGHERAAAARGGHGGYGESDTELLAGVCGPAPTDAVFTWAQAEKLLHIN